jgi:hypothetical protein
MSGEEIAPALYFEENSRKNLQISVLILFSLQINQVKKN